ncbi:SDR family NAD(P)-dependent oxidoreductase [Puniceibacterium sediminis]|uniref:NAD(P)-dependent dehydrogenase, short-chain alcohol dehydrogenase family n=1 Tax=Puniceibacterium sediminis TaxID=1608407 RepID=A0A238W0C3_9RHOB|nr:SDR family NAD(P)-dependent oxidoreductase [Puniceibacterium sediminis]SNR40055.1 NAD(P)-dependent dehydrogenase, short-chain alcohol dehydrogenase family [Puniceibacterium sediminis]
MTLQSGTDPKPVVAVTGASRGIGHAIVRHFYKQGWDVITLARTPFSEICPWADGIVQHLKVDLADTQSVLTAATDLKKLLNGRGLNALVNNAGISPKCPGGKRMSAIQTPVATFLDVQHVNLVAPFILCQELLEPLKQAGGSVVNISSIAAVRVHPFAGAAYAISKAGLSAFTRELAHELGNSGVRVNTVAPGEIQTSILSPGTDELVESQVPMKRLGRPEEVAEVVYFLASPLSSYVTGTEIPINGGQHT